MIALNELRRLLSYDPATGEFRWSAVPARACVTVGALAGCINNRGYRTITLRCDRYLAHRLAWFYVHGAWPASEIDHINGDRADNRICNLRLASVSENRRNARLRRDNANGFKGVWPAKNRWRAAIRINGKSEHLGTFSSPSEAHAAYAEAAKRHFGDFARCA